MVTVRDRVSLKKGCAGVRVRMGRAGVRLWLEWS